MSFFKKVYWEVRVYLYREDEVYTEEVYDASDSKGKAKTKAKEVFNQISESRNLEDFDVRVNRWVKEGWKDGWGVHWEEGYSLDVENSFELPIS